jgi:ribosomal protein L11 methyltransferase
VAGHRRRPLLAGLDPGLLRVHRDPARPHARRPLDLIRLALRVCRADAERVLAELIDLVPAGVEEVDAGDRVEYAVYGAPGELPSLPDLRAAAGGALVDVSTSEVADDWADRWRAFHRPLTVAGRVHVRPPWAPPPAAGLLDVVIDPGRAFGTGAHATTTLALELLVETTRPDGAAPSRGPAAVGPLADWGCGSGVLAIAGARLGHAPVVAVDHDPLAVQATAGNAAANGVAIAVRRADLHTDPLPAAPTVTANLLRPLLLVVAGRLPNPLPRTLVASGLLEHECDEVAAAFAARGLHEDARRAEGEWAALRLRSGGSG